MVAHAAESPIHVNINRAKLTVNPHLTSQPGEKLLTPVKFKERGGASAPVKKIPVSKKSTSSSTLISQGKDLAMDARGWIPGALVAGIWVANKRKSTIQVTSVPAKKEEEEEDKEVTASAEETEGAVAEEEPKGAMDIVNQQASATEKKQAQIAALSSNATDDEETKPDRILNPTFTSPKARREAGKKPRPMKVEPSKIKRESDVTDDAENEDAAMFPYNDEILPSQYAFLTATITTISAIAAQLH